MIIIVVIVIMIVVCASNAGSFDFKRSRSSQPTTYILLGSL